MNNFSISKCMGGAWDLTTRHWILCIVFLVIAVITSLISGSTSSVSTFNSYENMTLEELLQAYADMFNGAFYIKTFIAAIVQYVLYAGFYKMALNGYNGMPVNTTAYNMPLSTYVKFACGMIVLKILILVGLALCVIPGIIIGVRLFLVPYILLDEPETEFIDAFKKSWAMTSGKFWSLFGLILLILLINIIGLACCCVGIIFAIVMGVFMEIIAYYQLKDDINTHF